MKKLKLLGVLIVLFWIFQSCQSPNKEVHSNKEQQSTDYTTDTADTGKDTLGVGDGQGSDHTEDIP